MNTSVNKLADQLDRPLRDLRISVTDRCNFRCVYCMPKESFGKDHQFLPKGELLNYEEIQKVVTSAASLGVRKIRFTGGEPLVRRDLETLIEITAAVEGIEDISLTSNASLLTLARAKSLKAAGLKRINISLDSLDDHTFKSLNDVGVSVAKVLKGIENAREAGIESIKVNMVVKRGLNEQNILPMAHFFHGSGHILRFIEYMDVGTTNRWQQDEVVSANEIIDILNTELPIEPIDPNYPGEVAKRWRFVDGGGEIGVIASVTQPFCGDCHRARLSAVGQLYTCLFSPLGHDLRVLLRSGISQTQLTERLANIWGKRSDRYSELRGQLPAHLAVPKVEMSYIGG